MTKGDSPVHRELGGPEAVDAVFVLGTVASRAVGSTCLLDVSRARRSVTTMSHTVREVHQRDLQAFTR